MGPSPSLTRSAIFDKIWVTRSAFTPKSRQRTGDWFLDRAVTDRTLSKHPHQTGNVLQSFFTSFNTASLRHPEPTDDILSGRHSLSTPFEPEAETVLVEEELKL
ncbi:hypothetical protein JTE90_015097 [Oedothorax gibbosus]|uniref:Uncharacterized protein n=1 Tax=Oedothorax gibbosus TaxID=931172 RepID=A0AAV6VRL0_9ARAC|nr:hypothetical protein JTE90_015097 [Oedothorax gibbosus]